MARRLQVAVLDKMQAGYAVATFFLCAFALFMCASHVTRKLRRRCYRPWKACYGNQYNNDGPVIEMINDEWMMAQLPGNFQFGNNIVEGSAAPSCELSVWKKDIFMGRKCQLPDFSGVIIYDSAGNVVPQQEKPSSNNNLSSL